MNLRTGTAILQGVVLCLALGLLWLAEPAGAGEAEGGDTAAAETPSADEIVRRANHVQYYQGRDGRATVDMTITDKDGKERTRRFVVLRRDGEEKDDPSGKTDGAQKFYVYFQRPADWNKTVYLVHKHMGQDDDRWLYLPGLDLVKRIAASDERTSFVGSHFVYEDISGRNLTEDTHTVEKMTENAYVLRNTPKEPDTVEFSYYLVWVHKKTFLPYHTEYFDKKGKKYRVGSASKTETIDGYVTVTEAVMQNLNTGGKTVVRYSDIDYDMDLPESIFTERYLRNPPRKHLR